MKMESVVLSVQQKDVPLFNTDWIYAMGKETQLVELYDTMLEPFSEEAQAPFAAIRDRDKDRVHPTKRLRPVAAGTVSVPCFTLNWATLLPSYMKLFV